MSDSTEVIIWHFIKVWRSRHHIVSKKKIGGKKIFFSKGKEWQTASESPSKQKGKNKKKLNGKY